MFVYETVDKNDKELYEKVSDRLYDEKWSQWGADRDNNIYIVCIGKHGVETPVIFKMLYKAHTFEFILPEADINYDPPKLWISIPNELQNERIDIRETIKRAFREAKGLSDYGSLPENVDEHIFVFEVK